MSDEWLNLDDSIKRQMISTNILSNVMLDFRGLYVVFIA